MKPWLLLLAVLIVVVGCIPPPTPLSDSNIPDTIQDNGIISTINNNPTPTIEPSSLIQQHSLELSNIQIFNVTSTSAILQFNSTIPCTAEITLYNGEIKANHFSTTAKLTSQQIALTDLKSSTTYRVIINAQGSSQYKSVIEFTTLSEIPIYPNTTSTWFFGGYYHQVNNTSITATFISCDGTYSNNIWTVNGQPSETKSLRLSIYNGSYNKISVYMDSENTIYPTGGFNKILLIAPSIMIDARTTETITLTTTILNDAPIGKYKNKITLSYLTE